MDKYEALKKYFGHDAFRKGQEEVIDALAEGEDVLAVMPTGAGKSLCYQIPALLSEGITIVVSPLISLMKDQVTALIQAGVPAAYLNSSLTPGQLMTATRRARAGAYKLIYVAPERLRAPSFAALAAEADISYVIVDEAHCVSQWGQDFRPSYLGIEEFIDSLPVRPAVGAFTATATERVRDDIMSLIGLIEPYCITTGFDRENLYFSVQKPLDKYTALKTFIEQRKRKSGIVYCSTRKNVEEVCERLCADGIDATRYHAGLSDEERLRNQDAFRFDDKTVMVATNAFGMGIDKSNVSYVVHYNMPKDIESYYQEAGRAGRDGEYAECMLLFSRGDVATCRWLINNSDANEELSESERRAIRDKSLERLRRMTDYCETGGCLRKELLGYFGEVAATRCDNCSNCLGDSEFSAVAKRKRERADVADEALFELLKKLRKSMASSKGVPAYVICNDATLADMAAKKPTSVSMMTDISGIGEAKQRMYGKRFAETIAAYVEGQYDRDGRQEQKKPRKFTRGISRRG